MELVVTLEQDEDGAWVAECPAVPGCVSQGRTPDDAVANVRDTIRLCLAVRETMDISPPEIRIVTVDV